MTKQDRTRDDISERMVVLAEELGLTTRQVLARSIVRGLYGDVTLAVAEEIFEELIELFCDLDVRLAHPRTDDEKLAIRTRLLKFNKRLIALESDPAALQVLKSTAARADRRDKERRRGMH
jgi:hypothetical protein